MCSAEWRWSGLGSLRWIAARRGGLVVASSLAFGWAGCVDNNESIFIRQVVAFPEGSCTQTSDPSALTIGKGTLDIGLKTSYEATLLVGSQLVDRGNRQQLREETSRVELEGTEVYVVDGNGVKLFGPVTVPGSGFIDPASGTSPSYGLLSSVLLRVDDASPLNSAKTSFQPTVTAHVRAFGHTLGGQSVETGEYLFPISVCYRCLVTFPVDALTTTAGVTSCGSDVSTGSTVTAPCAFGQDETVDCRVCKEHLGGNPVCEPQ